MSQKRDECPKRNWSSIRHIWGKLFVIKEICSRYEKTINEVRKQYEGQSDPKWYAQLFHPKKNSHNKFEITTSTNIGFMLQTQ